MSHTAHNTRFTSARRTGPSGPRFILAMLACVGLATAAASAAPVEVSLRWEPNVIAFSGPDVYVLFQVVQATGFTDESHPDNEVRITSGTGAFTGRYITNGGGSSSSGWATLGELQSNIVGEGVWTMRITDGATGDISEYAFTVSSSGLDPAFFRSVTVDVAPGSTISASPTFTISQAPAPTPAAANTDANAGLFATNPSNTVFSVIPPAATTWSPTSPLNDDLYLLAITRIIDVAPPSFVVASTPTLVSGPAQLTSLTQSVRISASVQANNLLVGLGPPAAGFSFADFTDITELSFVGTAAQNGAELRVETADELDGSAGGVWHNTKQLVRDGFRSEFSFRVTTDFLSGDGIALVIHDDANTTAALGGTGSGIGYDGIDRAVAFEYDTFAFSDEFPPNHLSIQVDDGTGVFSGDFASAAANWPYPFLSDGAPHSMRVTNIDGNAFIFLDGSSVPELHAPLSMSSVGGRDITDPDGKAYVGITAGNGAARADWDVLSWSFTPGTSGCDSPNISDQPQSIRIYPGQTRNLSASAFATGSRPLDYRWFRSGRGLSDNANYLGTQSDTLSITYNLGDDVAGTYTLGAFENGGCGARISETAIISVACNPADVANTDGDPFPDLVIDNGDFALFFTAFFADPGDPLHLNADIANTDGETALDGAGPDGTVDNGDFSAFFTCFFTGC